MAAETEKTYAFRAFGKRGMEQRGGQIGEETLDRELLLRLVPEWEDDDWARGRFKAFTGQKADWEERLNFWKDMITRVALQLDLVVIDTQAVQQKWFLRDGLVPMGLQHALTEMKRSGELGEMEQVLGGRSSNTQWVGRILKNAIMWAGSQILPEGYADAEKPMEERLVVLRVLQERIDLFLKTMSEGSHSATSISTSAKIKDLCGGWETAELIIGCLLLQNKAKFVNVAGADQVEGFKLSLNNKPVAPVSESDRNILQLHWALEMLQIRLRILDGRIAQLRTSVIKSAKDGNKREALRYVRNMKVLELSRDNCANSMDKIDQVLGIIADAEMTKKVSEAIQVGVKAMKENHVSLEEVHHTLSELDEAVTLQKESDEMLAGAPLSLVDEDDEDLERELTALEEELDADGIQLPDVPTQPVTVPTQQDASESDQILPIDEEKALEKEFEKLALELG